MALTPTPDMKAALEWAQELKDNPSHDMQEERNAARALLAYAEQQKVIEGIKEFAKWALREGSWEGCSLDGGDVQDIAHKLGLISSHRATEANKHIWEPFENTEEGDEFFIFTSALASLVGKE